MGVTGQPSLLPQLTILTHKSQRGDRSPFGEADLLRLQGGVPEGEDLGDLVAVPLGGLAELEVERFSCRGDHVAVGQDHLPGEGPCGAADHGDPVAASELDWVGVVADVDVGEDVKELRHRCGVCCPSADRLCIARDVRDHLGVMDRVHRCDVAGVEGIIALLHEREQVCGPAGAAGCDGHDCSVSWSVMGQFTAAMAVVVRAASAPPDRHDFRFRLSVP